MDTPNYFLMQIIEFEFLNVEYQYFIANVTSTQCLQSIMKVH
jgi:hypothetical protein